MIKEDEMPNNSRKLCKARTKQEHIKYSNIVQLKELLKKPYKRNKLVDSMFSQSKEPKEGTIQAAN